MKANQKSRRVQWLRLGAVLPGFLFSNRVCAAEPPVLTNLSFEQLSQIQITTAAKRPEALADTAAAVSVLTGEDIHRLGVTTLPDALRYVPGMDVGLISSSTFGVSARGFGGQFANQLLVMMDGRSIYNPSFGGVYWQAQDTLFEDIDRIEVVRGPGGALWGANAVNGVINILSKSAKETQGTLVTAGGGTFYEGGVAAREGFKLSEKTFARVYAKFDQFGKTPLATVGDTPDDWWRSQAGFRLDSEPDASSSFTVQGDVHRVESGNSFPFTSFTAPGYVSFESFRNLNTGANLLGRWKRQFSETSELTASAYYDYFEDTSESGHQRLHTLDAEVQHNLSWGERQQFNWGLGYRATLDTIFPTRVLSVPGRQQANDQVFNLFAQDEIALVREKLFLTLGAKLEHNDYTGWEVSPSARLLWKAAENQTVWGAVSRAVTTPNHVNSGSTLDVLALPPGSLGPGSPASLVQLQGHSDRVEELLAYEIGYRIQPVARVSVDIAAFYNDYSQLLDSKNGAVIPGSPLIVPIDWVNAVDGHTYGVELALGWQPVDHWRLQGSYTSFKSDVVVAPGVRGDSGASPEHKFGLRSTVNLGSHWEWDTGLRFVGKLKSVSVPEYLELDLRLAWKPTANWEVALVGQNLLHEMHLESPRGLSPLLSEVPRSVYGKVTWKF